LIFSTLSSVRPRLHRLFRLGSGLAWRDLLTGGELPMKWSLLWVKQYLPHMGQSAFYGAACVLLSRDVLRMDPVIVATARMPTPTSPCAMLSDTAATAPTSHVQAMADQGA
jgi:hypothetical protein